MSEPKTPSTSTNEWQQNTASQTNGSYQLNVHGGYHHRLGGCPSCGHCPHCGRGGYASPYNPLPYQPLYPHPHPWYTHQGNTGYPTQFQNS
jgi:hypothetical protein